MDRYYCRPVKLYVGLIFDWHDSYLDVSLYGYSNGVVLFSISMPFRSSGKRYAYVNSKDHPWVCEWLVEKSIAFPTHRHLERDGFAYPEFRFNKEVLS